MIAVAAVEVAPVSVAAMLVAPEEAAPAIGLAAVVVVVGAD